MADLKWRRALFQFRPQLEQRLEMKHCITSLHEAVPGGFLTKKEEEDIMNQSPNYNRVRKMVEILTNKDRKAFEAFIAFLKKSAQTALAEELDIAAKEGSLSKTLNGLPQSTTSYC